MENSKFLSLSAKQFITGLLYVVIGAILGGSIDGITAMMNGTEFNWYATMLSAFVAGLTYVKTNLLTNSNGQILTKEPKNDLGSKDN